MGVLWYLVVVLGLFSICWMVAGEQTARWLFILVHLGCATAVLLLYVSEVSTRRVIETQRLDSAPSSQK